MKFFYLSLICFFLLSCGSSQHVTNSKILASTEQKYFLNTESQKYFPIDGISMKFFDNNKFVDIIIETNKILTLEKILNLGLCVSIDPSGKSKRVININYPLVPELKIPRKEYICDEISRTQNLYDSNFKDLELITGKQKRLETISRYNTKKGISIQIIRSKYMLFSYVLRLEKDIFFDTETNNIISIGISSVYQYEERYLSAMTSREVIKKRLDEYKVGDVEKINKEINERWININLSSDKAQ